MLIVEILTWLGKRAVAKIMHFDEELERLRRAYAADPDNKSLAHRIQVLEQRAGLIPHEITDRQQTAVLDPNNPLSCLVDLESFDARHYVPASIEVMTMGQQVVFGRDYEFDKDNGQVRWLIDPALDQEIEIRWRQWGEVEDEEDEDEDISPARRRLNRTLRQQQIYPPGMRLPGERINSPRFR